MSAKAATLTPSYHPSILPQLKWLIPSIPSPPSDAEIPSNGDEDTNEDPKSDDPFASDSFRMYEYKVRRCSRARTHDWTECPYAHPSEKARRRDPRRFNYSAQLCENFRRSGTCGRGDTCEFSHGIFECWLHPDRYRTQPCKDGRDCSRKVCFFAHNPHQLRVLPSAFRHNGTVNSPRYRPSCIICAAAKGNVDRIRQLPPLDLYLRGISYNSALSTDLVGSMDCLDLNGKRGFGMKDGDEDGERDGPDLDWVNELLM